MKQKSKQSDIMNVLLNPSSITAKNLENKKNLNHINNSNTLNSIFSLNEIHDENYMHNIDYIIKDDGKYLIIDYVQLYKSISYLSEIIRPWCSIKTGRGVSIRIINNISAELIFYDSTYYFKTTLPAKNTFDVGDMLFMDYHFLTKMKKKLPKSILIYTTDINEKDNCKYYIRLNIGDLQLYDCYLTSELQEIITKYYKPTTLLGSIEINELHKKIGTMCGLLEFEQDIKYKKINIYNGKMQFKQPLIFAKIKINLPNMIIDYKTARFLVKFCEKNKHGEIKIYLIDSKVPRYAIVYENTIFITNYTESKYIDVQTLLDDLETVPVDYSKLYHQLDSLTSITYSKGRITLENKNNSLMCTSNLVNSDLEIRIKTLGKITIPENEKYVTQHISLLHILKYLNPKIELRIGFKDYILYLVSSDIVIGIVCV